MYFLTKKIPLFWWSSKKFESKVNENFGDIVGPYLIKKINNREVHFVQPKKRKITELFTKIYFTAGSILAHIDKNCIVWGSGVIEKNTRVAKATFLAVRGPKTREILIKQGCEVPEIYGDPALLLPKFYTPNKSLKKYAVGIIPHYVDYIKVFEWYKNNDTIKVINLLNDSVEEVVDEICSCETIISSSLHGIIVAHTYQIPAVWVKFSDKLFGDDLKFYDYFSSVNKYDISSNFIHQKLSKEELVSLVLKNGILISKTTITNLQDELMKTCPF